MTSSILRHLAPLFFLVIDKKKSDIFPLQNIQLKNADILQTRVNLYLFIKQRLKTPSHKLKKTEFTSFSIHLTFPKPNYTPTTFNL